MLPVTSVCFPGPKVSPNCPRYTNWAHLRFAYNQLRPVLDGLVGICKSVRERVPRIVCPLDDLDVLALDEIHHAHDLHPPAHLSAVTRGHLHSSVPELRRPGRGGCGPVPVLPITSRHDWMSCVYGAVVSRRRILPRMRRRPQPFGGSAAAHDEMSSDAAVICTWVTRGRRRLARMHEMRRDVDRGCGVRQVVHAAGATGGDGRPERRIQRTRRSARRRAPVRYRPCPQCGKMMNRQNFGRLSGTIVDTCSGHGTFLDRGELHQVVAFILGGGLSRMRAAELERLKEEQARLRDLEMHLSRSRGGDR